jgi:hypothetical protein
LKLSLNLQLLSRVRRAAAAMHGVPTQGLKGRSGNDTADFNSKLTCHAVLCCAIMYLQQQGRELPGEASEAELAVVQQMRGLIISGQPYTERKSTFQVC